MIPWFQPGCLNHVHLNHIIERWHTYIAAPKEPDTIVQNAVDFDVDMDVSIAHDQPRCSDIILNAAQSNGSAALRRDEKKETTSHKNNQVAHSPPCV